MDGIHLGCLLPWQRGVARAVKNLGNLVHGQHPKVMNWIFIQGSAVAFAYRTRA